MFMNFDLFITRSKRSGDPGHREAGDPYSEDEPETDEQRKKRSDQPEHRASTDVQTVPL